MRGQVVLALIACGFALSACDKVARTAKRAEQKVERQSETWGEVSGHAGCATYEASKDTGKPSECFIKPRPSGPPTAPRMPSEPVPNKRRK